MRPTLPRQSSHSVLYLPRPVSMHGTRPTHLPREPAGYQSLSARTPRQTLPHGHSRPDVAHHPGPSESAPGLTHLCRIRAGHDSHRPPTVCRRGPGARPRQHRLRTGRIHRRPVPVGVSVGVVPLYQVRLKLHTLLDLRANIPMFIHVSDGKMHDVNVLDILAP